MIETIRPDAPGAPPARAGKSLDAKLARILADPSGTREFIIADAKDADMAFGITAPGQAHARRPCLNESAGRFKSLADYRQQIRDVTAQGLVDIMLLSCSNLERLAIRERLFEQSAITPAARANDTSDIWAVRNGRYPQAPSRSFRTATLEHIKYGCWQTDHRQPVLGADLGLYSITFTNDIEWDYKALSDYNQFRLECEQKGFRYFLEVFNPNVDPGFPAKKQYAFLNDHIIRALAGVTQSGRPLFLKVPYNGPAAIEELVHYDSELIVGIMGGSAGTTHDAFRLIHDAQKYGARVALFGRKINLSEHPLGFIKLLRAIVDGLIDPKEAVGEYHALLQQENIRPLRTLQRDLDLTNQVMRYR